MKLHLLIWILLSTLMLSVLEVEPKPMQRSINLETAVEKRLG